MQQQNNNNPENAPENAALLNSAPIDRESTKRVQIVSSKTMSEEARKDSVIETIGSLPERQVRIGCSSKNSLEFFSLCAII